MAEIYTPISRQEVLKTLVSKFGGVEVVRYFLTDALSDLQTMEVGLADNNPLQAARCCESLKESLSNIRALLEKKEYKAGVEKEIKNNMK